MQALDLVLTLPLTGALGTDPAETLRRMLDRWLPDFFRPMECHAVVSGERFERTPSAAAAAGDETWPGEVSGGGPVTRLVGPAQVSAPGLQGVLVGSMFSLRLIGGLRFVEPAVSPETQWYGRVAWTDADDHPAGFVTLAYLLFHGAERWREIRLSFPVLGYPVSGQLPRVDADGMPAGMQPAELVDRNRRLIVAAFVRGAQALGYEPQDVSWSVEAEDDTPKAVRDAIAALLPGSAGAS